MLSLHMAKSLQKEPNLFFKAKLNFKRNFHGYLKHCMILVTNPTEMFEYAVVL